MKKKKKENDSCEIFNALKEHHDKKLVLYKKIAGISLISKEYLCSYTFMTSLDGVVSVSKGITIDNVVSVNVHENPSFCSTLYVFKNGISTGLIVMCGRAVLSTNHSFIPNVVSKRKINLFCLLGS